MNWSMIRKSKRRFSSALLCVTMVCSMFTNTTSLSVLAAQGNPTGKKLVCEKEEHSHTADCYEPGELSCTLDEEEGHTHDEDCYEETLICDNAEEGHEHTAYCYEKSLICGKEESKGHTHGSKCYEQTLICDTEEHTHNADCYEIVEDTSEPGKETAIPSDATEKKCTCTSLCTEDEFNADCPVCSEDYTACELAKDADVENDLPDKEAIKRVKELFEAILTDYFADRSEENTIAKIVENMDEDTLAACMEQTVDAMNAFDGLTTGECDAFIAENEELYNAIYTELAEALAGRVNDDIAFYAEGYTAGATLNKIENTAMAYDKATGIVTITMPDFASTTYTKNGTTVNLQFKYDIYVDDDFGDCFFDIGTPTYPDNTVAGGNKYKIWGFGNISSGDLTANGQTQIDLKGAAYTQKIDISLIACSKETGNDGKPYWYGYAYYVLPNKITYDLNGGNIAGSADAKTEYLLKDDALATTFAEPTREGYAFAGWGTSTSGGTVTAVTGVNTTLYAQWESIHLTDGQQIADLGNINAGNNKYGITITNNHDGTISITNPLDRKITGESPISSIKFKYGTSEEGDLSHDGGGDLGGIVGHNSAGVKTDKFCDDCTEDWWAEEYDKAAEELSDTPINITDSLKLGGQNLYIWLVAAHSIQTRQSEWCYGSTSLSYMLPIKTIYHANGGSDAPATQWLASEDKGTEYDMTTAVPTRAGYVFAGWYTAESGGAKITNLDELIANAEFSAGGNDDDGGPWAWAKWEMNLYAQWKEASHTHSGYGSDINWTSTTSLPTTAGNYCLTADVFISDTWAVPKDGVVNLDLNGHNITMTGGKTVISVDGTTFNLYDCQNTGKITGGQGSIGDQNNSGGGIYVGVYASDTGNETFNMYGGSIAGNTAAGLGGGVFVQTNGDGGIRTFKLYAGTISNNTAYQGAGVQNQGIFHMSGGTITGNKATANGFIVGVYNDTNATFTMTGGKITGNEGLVPGVVLSGTVNLNGGEISGNTLGDAYGVDVYINPGVTINTDGTTKIGSLGLGYLSNSSAGKINFTGKLQQSEKIPVIFLDDNNGCTGSCTKTGTFTSAYPSKHDAADGSDKYFVLDGRYNTAQYAIAFTETNELQIIKLEKCTITFDANGGNVTPAKAETETNGKLASANIPTPTRDGFAFDGWYTAATGGTKIDENYVFPANTTVYAHWTQKQSYTVGVTASPTAGGTVTGGGTYEDGTSVTVKATANSDYHFAGWKEGEATVSTEAEYTFTVSKDVELIAVFEKEEGRTQVDVEVDSNAPNTQMNTDKQKLVDSNILTEAEKQQVADGEAAYIRLKVKALSEDSIPLADKTLLLAAAEKLAGAGANLTYIDISLYKQIGNNGAETKVKDILYTKISVTITIPEEIRTAPDGKNRSFYLLRVHEGETEAATINGVYEQSTGAFTFETDRFSTYAIAYKDTPAPDTYYDVKVSSGKAGAGTVTGGGRYQENTSVTVTATANSGYEFVRWTENAAEVSTNANYTFSITGNRDLVAEFKTTGGGSTGGGGSDNSSSSQTPGKHRDGSYDSTFTPSTKESGGTFHGSGNDWTYIKADGTQAKSEWIASGGDWYYFGEDGKMKFDWFLDPKSNLWYMLSRNHDGRFGAALRGWYYEDQDGKWYFLNPVTSEMMTGWQYIDHKRYYFAPSNEGQTYFGDNVNGWYFDPTRNIRPFGSMYRDEETPDGHRVDGNGARVQ